MPRTLDEFASDLTVATTAAVIAACTRSQANTLVNAAATGGEAAVRAAAENLSTDQLKAIQQQLRS